MKKFLLSRKAGFIVLALSVLIMTPVGIIRSLNRLAEDVEECFTEGVEVESPGSSYMSASLSSLLEERARASLGLVTVGNKFPDLSEETDALRQARERLLDASTISEKYAANQEIEEAWQTLYSMIPLSELSQADREIAESYSELLEKVQGSININQYNNLVDNFYNVTLSTFPGRLFADFITGPEYFGE